MSPGISVSKIPIPFSSIGGVTYSSEYTAVLNAMPTDPSDANKIIQSTWLDGIVAGGYYAKAELLDMFSCDTAANSLFNWKDPAGAHNPTVVNAPTFTAYAGFTGSIAATKYLRTHFLPATDGTIIGQNSICMMIGVGNNVWNDGDDIGVFDDGLDANRIGIRAGHSDGNAYFRCNGQGAQAVANANTIKYYTISRNNAVNYDIYINKIKVNRNTPSEGLAVKELFACGCNNNGTPAGSDHQLRFVFLFSYLTTVEVEAIIDLTEAYLDNYAKGLI